MAKFDDTLQKSTWGDVGECVPKVPTRPVVPLDLELIEQFLDVGMSVERIADYFNVTRQTIYNRCGTLVQKKMVLFEFDLLAKQKELADGGDRHMLIHLGKTRLGQKETTVVETGDRSNIKVQVVRPESKREVKQEVNDDVED